jgi:hypothetical protein
LVFQRAVLSHVLATYPTKTAAAKALGIPRAYLCRLIRERIIVTR